MIKKVAVIIFLIIFPFIKIIAQVKHQYPQTEQERRFSRIGSLFGEDKNIIYPYQDKHRKKLIRKIQVNPKVIWKSALEVLSNTNLILTDPECGVIITDWYFPKNMKNTSCKVTVLIKDAKDFDQFIQVFAHCRDPKKIQLPDFTAKTNRKLADIISQDIINKVKLSSMQNLENNKEIHGFNRN